MRHVTGHAIGQRTAADEKAHVLSIEKSGGRSVRALLAAPQIARAAKPMQFVMVKARDGVDPFLRRPFSLSAIEPDEGIIGITWDVVGRGTEIMAGWEPGDEIMVLGPLGNGLDLSEVSQKRHQSQNTEVSNASSSSTSSTQGSTTDDQHGTSSSGQPGRLFLIAGGTGLAPMFPLAKSAMGLGWDVSVFYGARSADLLHDCAPLRALGCQVDLCTDDGSVGPRSFVTDLARSALASAGPNDLAVSCGPTPMTRSLKRLCSELGVTLYVSLEERMACGTGLCKGCAVKMAPTYGEPGITGQGAHAATRVEAEVSGYYHVCSDGPVFLSTMVELGGEKA
ncbi:MAG: dihydroorotate dehydrogenase electron transfer subunit [Bacillota bacterium]